MPVYTYHCDNCGIQFDATQKFTDAHLIQCPECGKKTLRKVFTPVGIVFKGSGFYATDHRSPSGAPRSSHGDEKSESEKSEPAKPTEAAPAPAASSSEKVPDKS